MKKILLLTLAAAMLLSLCACGAAGEPKPETAEQPAEEPAETAEEPAAPAAEQEAATAEAAAAEEAAPAQETASAQETAPAQEAASSEPSGGHSGRMGGASGGMGGSMGKSGDAALQAMIAEVAPLFTTAEYTDAQTGLTLTYNVFLPAGWDGTQQYPMVVFIPDSSVVGRDAQAVLTQGWGALVWASAEEQAKHPCIVIAPVFTEVILDDHSGFVTTDWVDMVPRMVRNLAEVYHADMDRIYATGQSMGCMTFLIAAASAPDLFAAELFVDGQWDITALKGLESQTFFYIAAGGDAKACGGQDDVRAMLDADGVPYAWSDGWDAQADAETLTALVEAELAEGKTINFVRWETGTVLNGGFGMEHMASFDYAYKLEAVRDWLFRQSK